MFAGRGIDVQGEFMQIPVRNGFSLARLGARRAVDTRLLPERLRVGTGHHAGRARRHRYAGRDRPERVARLSFTQGAVMLQGVGETAWAPATLNAR